MALTMQEITWLIVFSQQYEFVYQLDGISSLRRVPSDVNKVTLQCILLEIVVNKKNCNFFCHLGFSSKEVIYLQVR